MWSGPAVRPCGPRGCGEAAGGQARRRGLRADTCPGEFAHSRQAARWWHWWGPRRTGCSTRHQSRIPTCQPIKKPRLTPPDRIIAVRRTRLAKIRRSALLLGPPQMVLAGTTTSSSFVNARPDIHPRATSHGACSCCGAPTSVRSLVHECAERTPGASRRTAKPPGRCPWGGPARSSSPECRPNPG